MKASELQYAIEFEKGWVHINAMDEEAAIVTAKNVARETFKNEKEPIKVIDTWLQPIG